MKSIIDLIKTILPVIIIVGLLKVTGLMGEITYVAQSAAVKAGVLNVNPSEPDKETKFDYGFTIKDLKGNKFAFDQYKGKVVFINLWATWCGPCKAETSSTRSTEPCPTRRARWRIRTSHCPTLARVSPRPKLSRGRSSLVTPSS